MLNWITEEDILLFIHIFKCAGTYFAGGIRYSFPDDGWNLINTNRDHPNHYWNMEEERKKKIKFIYGHMDFGLHEKLHGSSIYITTLRHPVERILSTYYSLREERCHNHHFHSIVTKYSLKECLTEDIYDEITDIYIRDLFFCHINNHQTRVLASMFHNAIMEDDLSRLVIGEDICQKAIENIEKFFSFIGIAEETHLYWESLNTRFGLRIPEKVWSHTDWRFTNCRSSGLTREDLDEETIGYIEKFNQFDLKLYNYMVENMERINTRPVIRC